MDRVGSQGGRSTRLGGAGLLLLAASLILSSGSALAASRSALAAIGDITEYPVPPPDSGPGFITAGPDGNLWFTDGNLAQVATPGGFPQDPVPPPRSEGEGHAPGAGGHPLVPCAGPGLGAH